MRRVLCIAFAPFPGTSRLYNQVSALRAGGHEVTVLCQRGEGESSGASEPGLIVRRLGVRKTRRSVGSYLLEWPAFLAAAFAAATRLSLRNRFDVVQVFNQPDLLILCGAVARLRGARLIMDYRDPSPETYMSRFGAGGRHPVVRILTWIERACLRAADHVVTVTEEYRERLEARGVPLERTSVFMNCPDAALFRFRPAQAGDGGSFTAVYHGTLARRLGPDCAVRAAARVREIIPGFRLLIFGEGELLASLKDLAGAEGLAQCVDIFGPVPVESVPEILSLADVGLVPMRKDVYTDTILPTKLLEYVASGVPVIASRTEAIRKTFSSDEICFCSPGDPEDLARRIIDLWREPAGRSLRAARARARYETLVNREAMVRSYVNLIEGGRPGAGTLETAAG